MKKTLKKILVVILIIFTINNFFISNMSFAAQGDDSIGDWLAKMLGSVVGLLTMPIRLVAIAIARAMNFLTALVAYIENDPVNGASDTSGKTITPFDILFNKVKLVDINFFDIGDDEDSVIYKIRSGVAGWYYTMRLIASAILLCILIYVGIRMAISTIASEKATYKKMLFDWVVSLALIYVLHYLIIFVINLNDIFVNALQFAGTAQENVADTYDKIIEMARSFTDPNSIAATIIYCLLVWQTLGLLISYFNRVLKLAFLLIISPLITLTYSIDKMGDGKAQALGAWLKEFVYTILIQPFHCIIYMSLIDVSFELLLDANRDNKNILAASIIALLCIKFIKEAENIVRKIFNFQDENSGTSLAAGLTTAALAVNYSKNAGKTIRTGINGAKNIKQNFASSFINARANAKVFGSLFNPANRGQSISQRKEEALTQIDEKKAEKTERKLSQENRNKVTVGRDANGNELVSKELADRTKALMDQGLSHNRARAQARKELAQEFKKAEKRERAPRVIKSARGALATGKEFVGSLETLKMLKGYSKASIAMGAATFAGSGMYAKDGNFMTAVGTGIATYNVTSEAFKNSTKTLTKGVKNSAKALGAKNSSELLSKLHQILPKGNGGGYADDSDELSNILNELKAQLRAAGVDDREAYTIQNKIKKNIADGNNINPADVIRQTIGNNRATPEVLNAGRNLNNFENEKAIYNAYQQASQLNISEATFTNGIMKTMTPGDYRESVANAPTTTSSSALAEESRSRDLANAEVLGATIDERKDAEREIDRMVTQKERELGEYQAYGLNIQGLEDEIQNLIRNKERIDDINCQETIRRIQATQRGIMNDDVAEQYIDEVYDTESLERKLDAAIALLERQVQSFSGARVTPALQNHIDDLNNKIDNCRVVKTKINP